MYTQSLAPFCENLKSQEFVSSVECWVLDFKKYEEDQLLFSLLSQTVPKFIDWLRNVPEGKKYMSDSTLGFVNNQISYFKVYVNTKGSIFDSSVEKI